FQCLGISIDTNDRDIVKSLQHHFSMSAHTQGCIDDDGLAMLPSGSFYTGRQEINHTSCHYWHMTFSSVWNGLLRTLLAVVASCHCAPLFYAVAAHKSDNSYFRSLSVHLAQGKAGQLFG